MNVIGYARVSSKEQNLERQLKALKGCNKIFSDTLTGSNTQRVGLQNMLSYLREGDTLRVTSIDRLARSTRDLLKIIDDLQKKDVKIEFLKEQLITDTAMGKFFLTIMASLAELERENIRERQAEGILIAKAKGKYKGRPRKDLPEDYQMVVDQWHKGEITASKACKDIGVCRATLYKLFPKPSR